MKLLLEAGCDPNVFDYSNKMTILSYSYQQKKHQAFEMLITKCKDVIDPNILDSTRTNTYGIIVYNSKLPWFTDKGFEPKPKLKLMIDNLGHKIDFH